MFDGISIWTRQVGLDESLFAISYLDFVKQHPVDDPEGASYHAKYMGLKINIYPTGLVIIRGSLHKFFNENGDNADDFTYGRLEATLAHLRDEFCIDLTMAEIHSVEFGFNLDLPFSTLQLLDNLICFKNKPFNTEPLGIRRAELSWYDLKVYPKNNLLRIELKIKKMNAFKGSPLFLSDLLEPLVWQQCYTQLKTAVYNIIFDEQLDLRNLSNVDRDTYLLGKNARLWSGKELTKVERCRMKKKFISITENNGNYHYREKLLEAIDYKFQHLSTTPL